MSIERATIQRFAAPSRARLRFRRRVAPRSPGCDARRWASRLRPRADIYSWTDEDGVVHFTNIKPQAAASGRRSSTSEPPKGSKARGASAARAATRSAPPTLARALPPLRRVHPRGLGALPDPGAADPRGDQGRERLRPAAWSRRWTARASCRCTPTVEIDMGVQGDIFDPRTNIMAGTRLLRWLANRVDGDLVLTIAGYHAGPRLAREVRLHRAAVHVHAAVPEDGARPLLPVQSRRDAARESTVMLRVEVQRGGAGRAAGDRSRRARVVIGSAHRRARPPAARAAAQRRACPHRRRRWRASVPCTSTASRATAARSATASRSRSAPIACARAGARGLAGVAAAAHREPRARAGARPARHRRRAVARDRARPGRRCEAHARAARVDARDRSRRRGELDHRSTRTCRARTPRSGAAGMASRSSTSSRRTARRSTASGRTAMASRSRDGALIELGKVVLRFRDPAEKHLRGERAAFVRRRGPRRPTMRAASARVEAARRGRARCRSTSRIAITVLALGALVWIARELASTQNSDSWRPLRLAGETASAASGSSCSFEAEPLHGRVEHRADRLRVHAVAAAAHAERES